MPDYLTIPSAAACLVLCAGLVASILALATDDWLEIKQEVTTVTNGMTNHSVAATVRYGLWRKCWISPDGEDFTMNGVTKSKHCNNLVDDGTTAWVMASAVMMIYATVASAVALVLWMIWTFFITKRSQSCLKTFTVILVISTVFFFFVVFIGWIAERENTTDDTFNNQSGSNIDYSYSFKWSWGMVILAFIVQIIAVILMLISGQRDPEEEDDDE